MVQIPAFFQNLCSNASGRAMRCTEKTPNSCLASSGLPQAVSTGWKFSADFMLHQPLVHFLHAV